MRTRLAHSATPTTTFAAARLQQSPLSPRINSQKGQHSKEKQRWAVLRGCMHEYIHSGSTLYAAMQVFSPSLCYYWLIRRLRMRQRRAAV